MAQAKKPGRPYGTLRPALAEFGAALVEFDRTELARRQVGARIINRDVLGDAVSHARVRADNLAWARGKARGNNVTNPSRVRRLQAIKAALADPTRRLGKLSSLAVANHLATSFSGVSVSTLRKDIAYLRKLAGLT